jgi:hypothetical protein
VPLGAVDTATDVLMLGTKTAAKAVLGKSAKAAAYKTALKKVSEKIAAKLAQSGAARIGVAGLTEGVEEGFQSGGEVVAGNIAARRQIERQGGAVQPDITEGAGRAAVEGAVGGVLAGGGIRGGVEATSAGGRAALNRFGKTTPRSDDAPAPMADVPTQDDLATGLEEQVPTDGGVSMTIENAPIPTDPVEIRRMRDVRKAEIGKELAAYVKKAGNTTKAKKLIPDYKKRVEELKNLIEEEDKESE